MVSPALLASVALAQEEVCPELHVADFEGYLEEVDAAFRAEELDRAAELLERGGPRVLCVREIVPTADVAAFAIRKAWASGLAGDAEETARWGTLARALDPRIEWPPYVPEAHAARQILADALPARTVTVQGFGFLLPPDQAVFVDGRFAARPAAESELPHLVQVGERGGAVVWAGWQDGAQFPSALLERAVGPRLPPEWLTAAPPPPRRRFTAPAVAGAVALGLYGTALVGRAAYDASPSDALFYTVDGAMVGAGVALTGGGVLLVRALWTPPP